jgi:S-layer homology domain
VGSSTGFGDVAPGDFAAAWIKQLAVDAITGGCGGGNYCPNSSVTRAQMAVFLLRAKHGSSYTPPDVGAGTGFGDVAPGDFAAAWIKQLVAEGITAGCGAGTYCPNAPVTRAQMAVFLVRTFNLP